VFTLKEREVLLDFARSLLKTHLTIILFVLDLAGMAAVLYWVVDDIGEAIVVILFLVIVLSSQYLVYRQLRLHVANLEQTKPTISFSKVRQAQLYHLSPVVEGRRPTYEILQVWFSNIPKSPLETSIARDVTAKIRIYRASTIEIFDQFEYHGQWAKTNAPDNVGYDDILDSVDIPPGHLESKLIIALKYPSDSNCFAFTREGLRSTPDGRTSKYAIAEGVYKIIIHLRGIGIDKEYCFDFKNPGVNQSLVLSYVSS
jgi:hypothetical protein